MKVSFYKDQIMNITPQQANFAIIAANNFRGIELPGYWSYTTAERDDKKHRNGKVVHFWLDDGEPIYKKIPICGWDDKNKSPEYISYYDNSKKPKCKKCLDELEKIANR
jgi:hypothetical protein